MIRLLDAGQLHASMAMALLLAGLTCCDVLQAQIAALKPGAKAPAWSSLPDWNGVWERDGHIGWDPAMTYDAPVNAPYNAQYLTKVQAARQAHPTGDLGDSCNSGGMPGMMTMVFPMEIEINPRQLTLIGEGQSSARRIYTDGRDHPADPFPSTVGHSIGQWRNKELFVDTCCLKPNQRIPGGGLHSDKLRIKEHFWATDPTTLKIEVTLIDPEAFTKPWTVVKTYRKRPDWEPVEYICTENNRNPVGAGGTTQVVLAGDEGFNPPPPSVTTSSTADDAPPVRPAVKSGTAFGPQQMKHATAVSLGNMAWESVSVSDVQKDATMVNWTSSTPTGKWRCEARADGSNPYCER